MFIKSLIKFLLFMLISFLVFADSFRITYPYATYEWMGWEEFSDATICRDKIYASSRSGWLYEGPFSGRSLDRKKKYPFPLLSLVCLEGKLFILSPNGIINLEGKRIIRVKGCRFALEKEKEFYVFTDKKILKYDGRYIREVELQGPTLSARVFRKKLAVLTPSKAWLISTDDFSFKSFPLFGRLNSLKNEGERKFLIDLDEASGNLIFLTGEEKGVFSVAVWNYRKEKKLWQKTFSKKVVSVGFWKRKAFVITAFKTPQQESNSFLNLYSQQGDVLEENFHFDYGISRAFAIGRYLIAFGELGVLEIFNSSLQNRFSLYFPSNDMIVDWMKFKDVDKNGEPDLIATTHSNWPNPEFRLKSVALLLWKTKEAKEGVIENFKQGRELERKLKIWEAIDHYEAALEVAQFVTPEKLPLFLSTYRRALRKVRVYLFIKDYIPYFLSFVAFSFLIFMIFKLTFRLKRTGCPPDKVLKDLSGTNFSHQVIHILRILSQKEGESLKEKFKENKEQLHQLFRHFLKYQAEFKKASLDWHYLFRRVKKSFKRLLRGKVSKEKVDKALQAVEELANKLRSLRGSVVENALKPAINSILPMAAEKGIKVEFDYQSSMQSFGDFYPEKLQEFRNAFYALLQNSVEAFENFKPREGEPVISISAEEDLYSLTIVISDNGKGMDKKSLSFMFKPGFSTKGHVRGYGLTGVKELFEEWGSIEVQSTPGEGTTIRIHMESEKLAR